MHKRELTWILLIGIAATLISSCAVTAGSTFGSVVAAEAEESALGKQVEQSDDGDYALIVRTDPADAEVLLNNLSFGSTPLFVESLEPGRYRMDVEKRGYYPVRRWIEISAGTTLTIELDLERITGFLQVDSVPSDAEITVAGLTLDDGFAELPVGTHVVRARRFGYQDATTTVVIRENRRTRISMTLEPAPFSLSEVRVSRSRFNPANPGATGTVRVTFRVTAPGDGELSVTGPNGEMVDTRRIPRFSTWEQSTSWPPDSLRNSLADGTYTLEITASGDDGNTFSQVRIVEIDSSIVIRHRAIWSPVPGLLYAPLPAPLPPASFQVSLSAAGIATIVDGAPVSRFPVKLGLRAGLGSRTELTVTGGVIANSEPLLDRFTAGAAVTWAPEPIRSGPFSAAVALAAGGSYRTPDPSGLYTGPDTLTDFPGAFVQLPLTFSLFAISISAAGEYHLSPAPVIFGTESAANEWTHYLYARLGVHFESGPVSAGVSVALRSEPFPDINALDLPVHAGAEIHWSIGSIVLSAFAAGEFESLAEFYFMGGAGFSTLF